MRIQLSDNKMLRLPKIGNIRKGIQVPVMNKETGKPATNKYGKIKTYPKELPHFVVNFEPAYPEIKQQFEEVYGKEPKSINCFLAASDPDRIWMSAFEAYTYSQRIGVSNGAFIDYLVDPTNNQVCVAAGMLKEQPTNPNSAVGRYLQGVEIGDQVEYDQDKPGFGELGFAAKGRLNVIIAELNERAFLTVHTGGRYGDVPHLEYMVDDIFELAKGINRSPIMIPFTLARYEVERKYKEDGKTKKRIGWDIQMKISSKVFEGVMQAYLADPIRLIAEGEPRMFPAPDDYIEVDSEPAFIPETAEALHPEVMPEEPDTSDMFIPDITPGFLVNEGVVDHPRHAEALMNLLKIPLFGSPADVGLARIKLYRKWRGAFGEDTPEGRQAAAAKAISGEVPPMLEI